MEKHYGSCGFMSPAGIRKLVRDRFMAGRWQLDAVGIGLEAPCPECVMEIFLMRSDGACTSKS